MSTHSHSWKVLVLAVAVALVPSARIAHADTPPPITPPPPPSPPAHSVVAHVAPHVAAAGQPLELVAMIDTPLAEAVAVRYRAIGATAWQDAPFERSSAGGFFATLPPLRAPGIEYYIHGVDAAGAEVVHFASAEAPHQVRVDPTLVDQLEAQSRARTADLDDEVSADVYGHNFGNRYGHTDRFLRGEVVYNHRLRREIDEVGFGFGSIGGKTPDSGDPTAVSVGHGERYGFGQVRFRIGTSVFLDSRVSLGVSDQGFTEGVRGQLTLGKPWRSCVQLGGEYLGDLGPTAWMRLQWDTTPPLLMGASIVRTDLPNATLARVGLYIAYDVQYRLTARYALRAQVSYGPRDGSAHWGGGAGASVAF